MGEIIKSIYATPGDDANAKKPEVVRDPEDVKMLAKCDKIDEEVKKSIDAIMDDPKNQKMFSRILVYNHPKFLIFSGSLMALIVGCSMPFTGVILSELLTYMTAPFPLLA